MSHALLAKPCLHERAEFDVSATIAPDSNVVCADLAARCADCGVMFKWQGMFGMTPSLSHPSLSEDREWLRLPMVASGEIPRRPLATEPTKGAA